MRVHLTIHGLETLDLATRIDNLKELVRVAGTTEAVFDAERGAEPVRAAARMRLAALYRAGGRPEDAVDTLQDAIREDADTVLQGEAIREQAKRRIDSILRAEGRAPYAKHDDAARAMLEAATGATAMDVLNRLLEHVPQRRSRSRGADAAR